MNAPINYQVIENNGKPEWAVVPYEDFLKLIKTEEKEETIPHEVVGYMIKGNMSLLKAWRKHLGLTQKEVAEKAGISQAAYSQMEKDNQKLHQATIEKLANAMGISVDQLKE